MRRHEITIALGLAVASVCVATAGDFVCLPATARFSGGDPLVISDETNGVVDATYVANRGYGNLAFDVETGPDLTGLRRRHAESRQVSRLRTCDTSPITADPGAAVTFAANVEAPDMRLFAPPSRIAEARLKAEQLLK